MLQSAFQACWLKVWDLQKELDPLLEEEFVVEGQVWVLLEALKYELKHCSVVGLLWRKVAGLALSDKLLEKPVADEVGEQVGFSLHHVPD